MRYLSIPGQTGQRLAIDEFEQQLKNLLLREILFMAHISGAVDDDKNTLEQIGQQFIDT